MRAACRIPNGGAWTPSGVGSPERGARGRCRGWQLSWCVRRVRGEARGSVGGWMRQARRSGTRSRQLPQGVCHAGGDLVPVGVPGAGETLSAVWPSLSCLLAS